MKLKRIKLVLTFNFQLTYTQKSIMYPIEFIQAVFKLSTTLELIELDVTVMNSFRLAFIKYNVVMGSARYFT